MLVSEIVEDVQRITAGSSYTEDMILAVINQGLLEIAGGGTRQHGNAKLAPLPNLFAVSTVTVLTLDSSVAMPASYHRGLKTVRNANGDRLRRYESYDKMVDRYFGQGGPPEAYCLIGNTIHVAPNPNIDTELTTTFFALPDEAIDGDEITCLPSHLQKRLLENFCCKTIYSEIEQGIEGHNPDTMKHESLYQMALTDLERLIGFEELPAINVGGESEQMESVY